MSRTSERGYYVRGSARQLVGYAGVSASRMRDGVINNLNHLQDEACQHWGGLNPPTVPFSGTPYWTQAITTPGTFTRLDRMPPVAGLMRAESDGTSARLIVTLSVASSVAGKVASFRTVMRPLSTALPGSSAGIADPNATHDKTTTSGTVVSLAPFALYASRLMSGWTGTAGYPTVDGSGNAGQVRVFLGQIDVFATAEVGASPIVYGISIREYVG